MSLTMTDEEFALYIENIRERLNENKQENVKTHTITTILIEEPKIDINQYVQFANEKSFEASIKQAFVEGMLYVLTRK